MKIKKITIILLLLMLISAVFIGGVSASAPILDDISVAPATLYYGTPSLFTANLATGSDPADSYTFYQSFDGITYNAVQTSASDTYSLTYNPSVSPKPATTAIWIKAIAENTDGTSNDVIKADIIRAHSPIISSFVGTPATLNYGGTTRLTVTLDSSSVSVVNYTYERLPAGSTTWETLGTTVNNFIDNTYTHPSNPSTIVEYRVTAHSLYGDATATCTVTFSGVSPVISSITASTSTAVYTQPVTVTANMQSGREADSYTWEYSDDGGVTFHTISIGLDNYCTLTYSPPTTSSTKNVRVRCTATNTYGTDSSYTDIVYNGVAPVLTSFTPSSNEIKYGQTVRLTAITQQYRDATSYKFERKIGSGSWSTLTSSTANNYYDTTYTSSSSTTTVTYRCTPTNAYGVGSSMTCTVTYVSGVTTTTVSDLLISSDTDTYKMAYEVSVPYEIVQTITIGNTDYGIIVGKRQIDLVFIKAENKTKVLIQTLSHSSGDIVKAEYLGGYLIFYDNANKVYICNVMTTGFSSLTEISGFTGNTVNDVDINNFNILVSSSTGSNHYGSLFNLNGALQFEVSGNADLDCFTLPRQTSDNSQTNCIICADNSTAISKKLRCYTSSTTYVESSSLSIIPDIVDITCFDSSTKAIVSSGIGNGYIVPYTLNSSSSSFGTPILIDNAKFSKVDATSYDIRFTGVSSDDAYYIMSGITGNKENTYSLNSAPISSKISRTDGQYMIGGETSGNVTILNYGSTWSNIQSYSMTGVIVDVDVNDTGQTVMSAIKYKAYLGYNQTKKDDSGTILTTKYYLKVTVLDDVGAPIPNTSVTLVGPSGATTGTTDNYGAVTFEVLSTKTYTIMANSESIVYTATNEALQYITIGGSSIIKQGITATCVKDNTGHIILNLTTESDYSGTFIVYNGSTRAVIQTFNMPLGRTFTADFDTTLHTDINNFACTLNINSSDGKNYKQTWNFTTEKRDSNGILILGEIPIIPADLKNNPIWNFAILGLIMLVGAIFSYNNSIKGCIVIGGVLILLRIFEWITIPWAFVIFIVVIGFLAVFSRASQDEGN